MRFHRLRLPGYVATDSPTTRAHSGRTQIARVKTPPSSHSPFDARHCATATASRSYATFYYKEGWNPYSAKLLFRLPLTLLSSPFLFPHFTVLHFDDPERIERLPSHIRGPGTGARAVCKGGNGSPLSSLLALALPTNPSHAFVSLVCSFRIISRSLCSLDDDAPLAISTLYSDLEVG